MQTVTKNPNWWRRRTSLERCLLVVSVLACITAIGLLSGLVFVLFKSQMAEELNKPSFTTSALALHEAGTSARHNKVTEDIIKSRICSNDSKQSNICLTNECIHTASEVLSKMKLEIEPCDDFYQFACGTYIDNTQIPEYKDKVDSLSVLSDKVQAQLKNIITEETSEKQFKHLKLPNALYRACMNTDLIENLGAEPLQQLVNRLGGWPVVMGDSWDRDNSWTWQDTVKKFRHLGFNMDYMIDFSIGGELKNSTKRILYLDQPYLGLRREYLIKGFNDTLVTAYFEYMIDLAVLFGADRETAIRALRESLQFEIALANISLSSEKRHNITDLYNPRSIRQLQVTCPHVNWLDYINALLSRGFNVDENEVINLVAPSFLEDFCKLIKATKKRTIANYILWRVHELAVPFLSEKFRKRKLQYTTILSGIQEQVARWKECVDIVSSKLKIAVGSLYVRKHFNQDSKAIALEMVNNIRGVFSQMLDEVEWMDIMTKQRAKKKLHSMTTHIGYPDELLDNDKLEEYYRNYDIDANKYFESLLKMNVLETEYSFMKLRQPVNKSEWIRLACPSVANAFYSPIENSIQFPAGILQGLFFNSQRPKYMNYGAIGIVIGHEITHGFDNQGRQFDYEGNLIDWWQPDTQKAYLNKAKCIIEQYGNYTDTQTGFSLNGINTQNENIADNGGLKESYLAYNKWMEKNGEEPKLPGLNYTPQQMFWISAAQTMCEKYRKESRKMYITTNYHSPGEFRVLGSMSNVQSFSRDFQCPEATSMNPVQKCQVW